VIGCVFVVAFMCAWRVCDFLVGVSFLEVSFVCWVFVCVLCIGECELGVPWVGNGSQCVWCVFGIPACVDCFVVCLVLFG